MEEKAILANVATIICKDILIDTALAMPAAPQFPLLNNSSDDDEDIRFLLFQEKTLRKRRKPNESNSSAIHRNTNSPNCQPASSSEVVIKKTKNEKPKQGVVQLNLINELPDFENHMHMKKMTFLHIFKSVRQRIQDGFPSNMPLQSAFSLSLWKLATDEHFEEISTKFHIPFSVCHATIRQFIQLISDSSKAYIRWPLSTKEQQNTLKGFQTDSQIKNIPNIFGVIAIKQLNVFFGGLDADVPTVLQIICNADQRIMDSFVEVARKYKFVDTPIAKSLALNKQTMPACAFLIGDQNFPIQENLMRPFSNASCERERNFNSLLQLALPLGQETLNAMSQRFHTLYALEAKDLDEVRQIVATVCALHNLCIDLEDDYVTHMKSPDRTNLYVDIGPNGEQHVAGLLRRNALMDKILQC